MSAATRIWTPIDYDADGKQCDCLRLPFSTDLSAYGFVPIPIACIKSGNGPTALLVAGSHGDEYEGQVALNNLIRELECGDLNGRIIILPALNFPAVKAGRRVSPLDDGNLNRLFPGDAMGSPTQMIAHYVSEVLIPLSDVVIDLHAGGRSLDYLPSALIRAGRTSEETNNLVELARVFGAPISSISDGSGGGGATTLAATAQMLNVPAITAELGGGAALSEKGKDLAEQGVWRVLEHFGIVRGAPGQRWSAVTRLMKVQGRDAFTYAQITGIFEPAAGLGETVVEGQLAGKIHPIGWPMQDVEVIHFKQSGLVACRRAPSLTKPGDCLFKIMGDLDADAGVMG